MTQPTTPRDPHSDKALIDELVTEGGAQSSRSGGRLADEVATRDELKAPLGGDAGQTRATGADKAQPAAPGKADHQGAQD